MLSHRQNNVLKATSGASTEPQFAASYVVYVFSVGAYANAASSDTTPTVDAGHSFAATHKMLIWDGLAATFVAEGLASVTATGLTFSSATPSISLGDLLVNLGADTASGSTPAFDAGTQVIWSDPDGSTAITGNKVTTDATGNYDYYYKGDGRFWEVITNASGTVVSVIDGFGDSNGRFNVCDFGAAGDGTTDDTTAIQSALNAVTASHEHVVFPSHTYVVTAALTLPAFNFVVIEGIGRPTLDVSSTLGTSDYAVTIAQRGTKLRNFFIDGAAANTNGIKITGASQVQLEDVYLQDLKDALTLINVNDSSAFTSLRCFNNTRDVVFATTKSTSCRFHDCMFEESDQAVYSNIALTNIVFRDCNFKSQPASADTKCVHFDAIFAIACEFNGCRFESGQSGTTVYNLWVEGASANFPVEALSVHRCYFTGWPTDHIHVADRCVGLNIKHNHFINDNAPSGFDINYNDTADNPVYIEGNVESDDGVLAIALNGAALLGDTQQIQETVTAASPTLLHWGVTFLDSSSTAITATLGSGTSATGLLKTIVMTNASSSSTVSVTNHETSDPEVITFAAVDDTAVLMWTGTEWITIKLSGATV